MVFSEYLQFLWWDKSHKLLHPISILSEFVYMYLNHSTLNFTWEVLYFVQYFARYLMLRLLLSQLHEHNKPGFLVGDSLSGGNSMSSVGANWTRYRLRFSDPGLNTNTGGPVQRLQPSRALTTVWSFSMSKRGVGGSGRGVKPLVQKPWGGLRVTFSG